jgi:asparagine synthase (glutamine-hydrolysing)
MEQKLRVRETRSIVRRGMRGILPEKVRTRRGKASFDEATSMGLRKEFDRASQLTSSSCLATLGIVNRERFHAALEAASLGLVQESWLFSAALSLELWLNTLLRGQRVELTALETAQDNLTTYPPMQSRA